MRICSSLQIIISYLEESWAAITLLGTYESSNDLGSDEPT